MEQRSACRLVDCGHSVTPAVAVRGRRRGPSKGMLLMSEPACTAATLHSPAPVLSVGPVVLPAPGRAVDLQVRISAPVTGSELPVILLSHGLGLSNNLSSMNGYAPLAHFW